MLSYSPTHLATGVLSAANRTVPVAARVEPYTLVHVVVGETTKDLIIPQVVGHMIAQAETPGADCPARVLVLFLEPARVALRRAVRRRVRELRRAAPSLTLRLVPFVSRLGLTKNAGIVRRFLGLSRNASLVFHCRGETAAQWAAAIAKHMPNAGIVVDIRGAWPEELIFARGYHEIEGADPETRADHDAAVAVLHEAFARAGAVLSVSPGMIDWLDAMGVEESKRFYIPCCVSRLTYTSVDRAAVRTSLGIADKHVFAYAGTITKYQHVEDGVVPFVRALTRLSSTTHFLCLTNDVGGMRAALARGGVGETRATVICAPQSEVARYLSAADAGLLLRAPSRLNRLSQPTKLGEYLGAGVPVVVARGTGVVGEIVSDADAGIVVDIFGRDESGIAAEARRALDVIVLNGARMRDHALRLCDEHFTWRHYVARARSAYRMSLDA